MSGITSIAKKLCTYVCTINKGSMYLADHGLRIIGSCDMHVQLDLENTNYGYLLSLKSLIYSVHPK